MSPPPEREDDAPLLAFFDRLAESAGTARLSAQEVTELLRLAKVVADLSERRFAPVSCYVAGLAVAASAEPAGPGRAARIRALTETIHATFGPGTAS